MLKVVFLPVLVSVEIIAVVALSLKVAKYALQWTPIFKKGSLRLLTAMPSMAQYTRRSYNRPVAPYRAGYQTSDPRFHSPIGGYFGLRLGVGASVVNADDHQLDGGSPKAGLNVGFAAGIQVAPATPLYLESGLYYIEKGGKLGRKVGSVKTAEQMKAEYREVISLLRKGYSIRDVAKLSGKGVSTVQRVKRLLKVQSTQ